jgi:hypothetical protein
MQEMGIAKLPEDKSRLKKVLVLHTLKVKRPWNLLQGNFQMRLPWSELPHELINELCCATLVLDRTEVSTIIERIEP